MSFKINWRLLHKITLIGGCISPFIIAAFLLGFKRGWIEAIKWLSTLGYS